MNEPHLVSGPRHWVGPERAFFWSAMAFIVFCIFVALAWTFATEYTGDGREPLRQNPEKAAARGGK
jgi:hypothetical protein